MDVSQGILESFLGHWEIFFNVFVKFLWICVFFGVSPNEMLGSHDSDGRNTPDNVRQLQHNQGFFESRLFRAQKPCFWTSRWGRKRRKTQRTLIILIDLDVLGNTWCMPAFLGVWVHVSLLDYQGVIFFWNKTTWVLFRLRYRMPTGSTTSPAVPLFRWVAWHGGVHFQMQRASTGYVSIFLMLNIQCYYGMRHTTLYWCIISAVPVTACGSGAALCLQSLEQAVTK